MAIKNESAPEFRAPTGPQLNEGLIARLTQLQHSLTLCPTDILTRCELAASLEQVERHEEALFHWKAVLACDPNNLKAREGLARCRRHLGRPLQSSL